MSSIHARARVTVDVEGGRHAKFPIYMQEAVIAQVVVHIRNQIEKAMRLHNSFDIGLRVGALRELRPHLGVGTFLGFRRSTPAW